MQLTLTSRDSTEHEAPSLSANTLLMIFTMSFSIVLPLAEYSSTSTIIPVGPVLALPVEDMTNVRCCVGTAISKHRLATLANPYDKRPLTKISHQDPNEAGFSRFIIANEECE